MGGILIAILVVVSQEENNVHWVLCSVSLLVSGSCIYCRLCGLFSSSFFSRRSCRLLYLACSLVSQIFLCLLISFSCCLVLLDVVRSVINITKFSFVYYMDYTIFGSRIEWVWCMGYLCQLNSFEKRHHLIVSDFDIYWPVDKYVSCRSEKIHSLIF